MITAEEAAKKTLPVTEVHERLVDGLMLSAEQCVLRAMSYGETEANVTVYEMHVDAFRSRLESLGYRFKAPTKDHPTRATISW